MPATCIVLYWSIPMLNLPTTPQEYTQFALEYSGYELYDHVLQEACKSIYRGLPPMQIPVIKQVVEWIEYTAMNFPEYVNIQDRDSDDEHVEIAVGHVFVIAYGKGTTFEQNLNKLLKP